MALKMQQGDFAEIDSAPLRDWLNSGNFLTAQKGEIHSIVN